MDDPHMDRHRTRRSSSSTAIRFIGIFNKPALPDSNPLELEESDVVWSTTASDLFYSSSANDHSPARSTASSSPSNLPLHPFRPETLGLSAAFSDDHVSLLKRKPSLNASLSAACAVRTIPPVPFSRSSEDAVSHSAPVAVPVWLKGRRPPSFDVDGDKDEGNEEMVPPHEIVARSDATSFSVIEGVGRTLKGRDMRRVRDAVWQKTGFVD